MKVVHAGDLHVWRVAIPPSECLYPKRWLGSANLVLNRAAKFPPAFREPALAAIAAEEPDLMVFTGDFTQGSLASEFRECARLFAPIFGTLGNRLFALPGNHDVYTRRSVRKRLLAKHLPWAHTAPATRLDLPGALTLVGVNHSEPFLLKSNGRVRRHAQEALRAILGACQKDQRTVILVGHYPYATPPEHPESPEHKLLGEDLFAELIAEFRPPLYLHGHKHVRWALHPGITPGTLCLNCGSLGMRSASPEKQSGFLSWDQQEDGTIRHLTAHTFDNKDTWRKTPLDIRETS